MSELRFRVEVPEGVEVAEPPGARLERVRLARDEPDPIVAAVAEPDGVVVAVQRVLEEVPPAQADVLLVEIDRARRLGPEMMGRVASVASQAGIGEVQVLVHELG